ncbi:single-stranded DNA-binding protein [Pseudonocardia broussonetiae]|uniref:Single-stranded DNA-binding protein n=1 Tax=Pseudonocardia broussonetiae TaxID=2736640 RepID=A0A6M6JL57_9PSEU|nr:single-stranded DNA-binding protein [Pseudonocardia broussonetiae]QJY47923.1 single-stranded DNA-binding protein [Pseudonocardia broussonetiae]
MNKITVHGNLTGKPELRHSRSGVPVTTFTIAANRRRLNRQTGNWVDLPAVFHRVVCFNALAENVAASLDKGTPVAVTGEFTDDSYKREDGSMVRRIQIEAADVAASLRYATATLTKNPRNGAIAPPADEPDRAEDRAEAVEGPALTVVGSD